MSKKAIGDQQSAVSDQESAVSGQRTEEAQPAALYEVKDWKGKALCVCPLCGFDTLMKIKMLQHLVSKHDSELALVALVDMEKDSPSAPSALRASPPNSESTNLGEKEQNGVFEVELVEIGSAMDAQGNEHKTFSVKEN